MGCFWGAERRFWKLSGVFSTQVGYANGYTPNPTYEEVCTGGTGHSEVVRVVYTPDETSYTDLLLKPWYNAISWDQGTEACQGFTRTFSHEATPSHVSHVYTSDKDVCLGEGYTNISGMCIMFFPDFHLNWTQSRDLCISEGGRLVVADTMDKYNYIANQVNTDIVFKDISNWNVGAQKVQDQWRWSTGQMLSQGINVLVNQPTHAFCLGFNLGGLDDSDCKWSANLSAKNEHTYSTVYGYVPSIPIWTRQRENYPL